jgi:MFS family permease
MSPSAPSGPRAPGRHRADHGRSSKVAARLMTWVPPGRTSRRLLVLFMIDSVGTGLFLAGSALFFTRVMGLSVGQVGLGLSLSGVTGFVCAVPLGRLADRFGSRRLLVLLYLWRGLGFVAYAFIHDFLAFVVIACLLGAAEWAVGPLVRALVATVEPDDGSPVRTMAAMNAVRNVGFTVGALLATAAIASQDPTAYRALVVADAVSFLLAAGLLARLPLTVGPRAVPRTAERSVRVRDPIFLLLTTSNGVLYLHTAVLSVGLPLWISTRTDAPATMVGAVIALNTVLAVVLGLRLSGGSDGVVPAASRQHWAGWCLAACCVLVAVTGSVPSAPASALLLAAAVALTLGEVFQSLGSWGLSYALSPEEQRNYYLTVWNLGDTGATIVGPAVLTAGVLQAGAHGWLVLAGVFALVGMAVPLLARRAGRPSDRARGRVEEPSADRHRHGPPATVPIEAG